MSLDDIRRYQEILRVLAVHQDAVDQRVIIRKPLVIKLIFQSCHRLVLFTRSGAVQLVTVRFRPDRNCHHQK